MKILITGGAGFIGSAFVRTTLALDPEARIVNLDKLTYAGNLENLAPVESDDRQRGRYRFVKGDICDAALLEQLLAEEQPDSIVHFAAESHVDRSIHAPTPVFDTNLRGTFTLLEAIRARPVKRFVHVSTDEVYGSLTAPLEADEQFPLKTASPYSASKAGSDLLVLSYFTTYKLPVLVTRASNNYGPYHFPEKLIPLIIIKCLAGETLPVYGAGDNVRDWLYVDDHVRALQAVFEKGVTGESYMVGGSSERTNLAVVHNICDTLDRIKPRANGKSYRDQISFVADRPGHDFRYAIDATKLQRDLGWKPQESFESGMEKTIYWYLQNMDWWQAIQSGAYRGERLGLTSA